MLAFLLVASLALTALMLRAQIKTDSLSFIEAIILGL